MFQLCVFPGGTTQFLQPVDVGYAGKVRFEYQAHYHQWLSNGKAGATTSKAHAERMLGWLAKAHDSTLCALDIPSIFARTGISSHDEIKILNLPYVFKVPEHVPKVESTTATGNALVATLPSMFSRKIQKRQREEAVEADDGVEVMVLIQPEVQQVPAPPPRPAPKRRPGRPVLFHQSTTAQR